MSGAIFHLKYPRMKHEENSNRGDKEALRTGCIGIDLDMQKDADGIIWNTHWKDVVDRDKFRDPLGKVKKGTKFHTLHEKAIRRLVAVTDGKEFHIRTQAEGIRHAAATGLKVVHAEAKPNNVWTVQDFRYLKRVAQSAGIGLVIITMDNWNGWKQTLENARAAGCETRRIRMH